MPRKLSQSKEQMKRGAWTEAEDEILRNYVKLKGEGKWNKIPKETSLKRCGKSCRLRWLKYLRPDIKRGNITDDERDLIIRLHKLLGNRWSLIAGRLPGRTDNEIKNYWNTNIAKKMPITNHNHRRSIPNTIESNSTVPITRQDQLFVEPSQSSPSETPNNSSLGHGKGDDNEDQSPMSDALSQMNNGFLLNISQFSNNINVRDDQLLVEPSQSCRSETPWSLDHGKGDDNDRSPMSDSLSMMNDEFLLNISQELMLELQGGDMSTNGGCGSSSYDPLMFWEELETMFDSDAMLQLSMAPRS